MSDDASSVLESVADLLCSIDREGIAELVRAIGVEYDRMGGEIKQLRDRIRELEEKRIANMTWEELLDRFQEIREDESDE